VANAKLLYVETFGCQMNVSDSEKMTALLKEHGYGATSDPACADLIILNTCSIRAKAEQRVYHSLNRFKPMKRANRRLIIGVGGCVAQQEGERLLQKAPHLDLVFGTHNLARLPELVRAAEQGERRVEVGFAEDDTSRLLFPQVADAPGVARFVTVMQGCDNYCSYCIVPYVRGREISRPTAAILEEVRSLADRGVKEVTLLGQNVNSYGRQAETEPDFPALLRQVAAVDGIERLRFTTSHPRDLSPNLIACFAELPKLCGHIHLPPQAGSNAVLTRMNRGYSREEYLSKIAALRAACPDLLITGDMIIGFPGETEADFAQTLALMEEVRYADLFYFVYSARPGTKAAEFPELLDAGEKQARLEQLQTLQRQMTLECNQALLGTRQQLLVEGVSRRGDQLYGRTGGNRVVNFSGDTALIGGLVTVAVTEAFQNSLQGEICET